VDIHRDDGRTKPIKQFSIYFQSAEERPKVHDHYSHNFYRDTPQAIIDRFVRYPHRNAMLCRKSSPKGLAFLTEPGSAF
jgi:uncharacterized protein (DUF924 family)